MNKKDFDTIIRDNLKRDTDLVPNENYYTDSAFGDFVDEMKTKYKSFYDRYNNGKGNELVAKDGSRPKMASVASSSRFCYYAFRDIATAEVEKPCRIKGITGTPPQMDAFLKSENAFIEVKCHEIFDSHRIVLSKQYWKYLFGNGNSFGFKIYKDDEKVNPVMKEEPTESTFELKLSDFKIKTKTHRFDFKQFLCHLLGIAFPAVDSEKVENPKLVYLFFKPVCENGEIEAIFNELKEEIEMIFNNMYIKNFCKTHNIKLYAIAQNTLTMEKLTKENYILLYSIESKS